MDQKLFEQAIEPYVIKIVDKNNPAIVEYELKRSFRISTLEKGENEFKPRPHVSRKPTNKVYVTPQGNFDTAHDAAAHYQVSVGQIYNWIVKSRKLNNKEYYIYEKGETDQSDQSVLGSTV